jgi:hypothetical protein
VGTPLTLQRLQRLHDRPHRQHAVHDHGEPWLPGRAELARQRLDAARLRQQRPSLRQHHDALRGEARAVAAAVEERHPKRVLQLAHRVAHGRLRLVQRGGGGGEAAVLVDGVERLVAVERRSDHRTS